MAFRALFFGSPSFAVPSLQALHGIAEVVGVVCQPDKPAGRGLALTAPPTKALALELGLPVAQPTKLRTGEFGAWVRAQEAAVALVVAYGRILPSDVLAGPRLGCVNVHASLLPKYRGAAPIVWSIAKGETETGITLMKLDEGMDTGPTFARITTSIGPDESAGELASRLAKLGANAVREWLPKYVAGQCALEPQEDAHASLAPMLAKDHGRIDWSKPPREVHDHVRAMNPWPGAFTTLLGHTVKVHATSIGGAEVLLRGDAETRVGRVRLADKRHVLVACGGGCIELVSVQPEGRRAMSAAQWAMGRGISEGDVLGE